LKCPYSIQSNHSLGSHLNDDASRATQRLWRKESTGHIEHCGQINEGSTRFDGHGLAIGTAHSCGEVAVVFGLTAHFSIAANNARLHSSTVLHKFGKHTNNVALHCSALVSQSYHACHRSPMFKSSSRGRPRPVGLMGSSKGEDSVKVLLMIVAGVGLVGVFVMVMIRSQLLATLSELHGDIDAEKTFVAGLKRRLGDCESQLGIERRRVEELRAEYAHEADRSTHKLEELYEQVRSLNEHLETCRGAHADARGANEHLQGTLTVEIDECRADVADLQKDVATLQSSLKKQQALTLEWKAAYDSEFNAHTAAQLSVSELRDELRSCRDDSRSYRAHAGHPPVHAAKEADLDVQQRARVTHRAEEVHPPAPNMVGPPGELQGPKSQPRTRYSGARITEDVIGTQVPGHHLPDAEQHTAAHVAAQHLAEHEHLNHLDDDIYDRGHYHHGEHAAEVPHGGTGDPHPHTGHAEDHGHYHDEDHGHHHEEDHGHHHQEDDGHHHEEYHGHHHEEDHGHHHQEDHGHHQEDHHEEFDHPESHYEHQLHGDHPHHGDAHEDDRELHGVHDRELRGMHAHEDGVAHGHGPLEGGPGSAAEAHLSHDAEVGHRHEEHGHMHDSAPREHAGAGHAQADDGMHGRQHLVEPPPVRVQVRESFA
jgi:polyhydroxyalkanoate synthesis regulator phasin